MELIKLIYKLRSRVCEYRNQKHEMEISTHLNSVDIVLSLSELAIRDKRPITKDEENWFRAGIYLSYVFDGSKWEDIHADFEIIANAMESSNYYRQ